MSLPVVVEAYVRLLTGRLADTLGDALAGAYVHGSAAMGGWHSGASDVDILAVTSRGLASNEKAAVARALTTIPPVGAGLEFSLVRGDTLTEAMPWYPFELHMTTGADAKVVDGAGHPGDADLLMHYAVLRERGIAVLGAPPREVFPLIPRELIVSYLGSELRWALEHAPAHYAVLNACRASAFLETGELLSKLEGAGWAAARGMPGGLIRSALAAQALGSGALPRAAVEEFVGMVLGHVSDSE